MHELTAAALAEDSSTKFQCACCGKALKNHANIKWVEMSESTTFYKLTSTMPDDEVSQGCFPMGDACYRAAKPL
jgi:hypothetical protein